MIKFYIYTASQGFVLATDEQLKELDPDSKLNEWDPSELGYREMCKTQTDAFDGAVDYVTRLVIYTHSEKDHMLADICIGGMLWFVFIPDLPSLLQFRKEYDRLFEPKDPTPMTGFDWMAMSVLAINSIVKEEPVSQSAIDHAYKRAIDFLDKKLQFHND